MLARTSLNRESRIGLSFVLVLGMASGVSVARAADLAVVNVSPSPRTLTAPVDSAISVTFDKPVAPSSITPLGSFWAFGRWSGTVSGTFTFSNSDTTVTLTPDEPFSAGESVMVVLSHDITATDATTLRSSGYSFQFWTRARPNAMTFEQVGVLEVRSSPASPTQAYGGFASDLNEDRFLDVSIVNEITADLRVFLNKADHTGQYDPFITPTSPLGQQASPSEPSDFNRDGHVDVCVAAISANRVVVLLGNGDGTFDPPQNITVGSRPRGIAVLDVDGDGDTDIVNTNFNSNNMSVLINDGSGVFSAPTFFEGGGVGEWALAAGDMNEDGLLDAVVGAQTGQRIIVNLSNGDGTFTSTTPQLSGGAVWMLVLGDVNGDQHEDVSVVNSSTNRGSILLGDGAGNIAAPTNYVTDAFTLATDLGDLDGDGDLDWVTSSFSGDWFVFRNNGSGVFSFAEELPAVEASSCSLMFDFDNDGDLDLGLIDEIADTVTLMRNSGFNPVPATSAWGLAVFILLILVAGSIRAARRSIRQAVA